MTFAYRRRLRKIFNIKNYNLTSETETEFRSHIHALRFHIHVVKDFFMINTFMKDLVRINIFYNRVLFFQ